MGSYVDVPEQHVRQHLQHVMMVIQQQKTTLKHEHVNVSEIFHEKIHMEQHVMMEMQLQKMISKMGHEIV